VLVTHGPPWGILDTGYDGQHYGSRALARRVERGPPRLHLFGHIHQSFGIDGTRVNGSYPLSRRFVAVDVDRAEAWILPD
jgi:Icc-related predicted phosphoesterase